MESEFRGACFKFEGDKGQQLEIADSRGELLRKMSNKRCTARRFKDSIGSDFVKHSSSFGGSGVDWWCHFEGAFEAPKS